MTPIGVRYLIRKDAIAAYGPVAVGFNQGSRFARSMARTAAEAGLVVDPASVSVSIRDMDEHGDRLGISQAFEVTVHGEAYPR